MKIEHLGLSHNDSNDCSNSNGSNSNGNGGIFEAAIDSSTRFFISNSIFELSLRLLRIRADFSLKVA